MDHPASLRRGTYELCMRNVLANTIELITRLHVFPFVLLARSILEIRFHIQYTKGAHKLEMKTTTTSFLRLSSHLRSTRRRDVQGQGAKKQLTKSKDDLVQVENC